MAESLESTKNIVLCLDGTGDWAAKHFTNVMKLYQRLDRDRQAVFYSGGVGTLGSPIALSRWRRMFLRLLDLATATSLRDRVLEGYAFIAREYEPGCRIYLFGFSRGAFTARLIASLVHNFGILEPRNLHLAPYLWEAIAELRSIGDFKEDARIIRQQFGRAGETKVHLMGLFDTVSSVGVFERFQVFPYTDKNPSVRTILHAVSLDERRNCFPELLIHPDGNHVEEVWFPGVHRDVGGGCATDFGLENDVLEWMLGRLSESGLLLREASLPPSERRVHLPVFDPYVLAGIYPQLMFDHGLNDRRQRNFSLWRPWRWFGNRGKDPGFRYFWPNFLHSRHVPQNGFVAAGAGQVRKNDGSAPIPFNEVANLEPPKATSSVSRGSESVGIVLGVAAALLITNSALGEPFGPSWPHPWAAGGTFALFMLDLLFQGLRQGLEANSSMKWLPRAMVPIGAGLVLVLACLVGREVAWTALYWGLGAGALVAAVAGLGARPALAAPRAIPLVFFPAITVAGGGWLAERIASALPATRWVEPSGVASIAMGLAGWAFLSGLLQIAQDRGKMG